MEKENIEVISIVLDTGLSKESLERAKSYIQLILERKVVEGPREKVCLLIWDATGGRRFKSALTAPPLGTLGDEFSHLLQSIQTSSASGNCIKEVMNAMDYIDKEIQKENTTFASKIMLLLTQLPGFGWKYSDDQVHDVVTRIKKSKTKLVVIDLTTQKQRAGQDVLNKILQDVNGLFYSVSEEKPRHETETFQEFASHRPSSRSSKVEKYKVGTSAGFDDIINFIRGSKEDKSKQEKHGDISMPKEEAQAVEEQNAEQSMDEDKDKEPVPVARAAAESPIEDSISEEEAILKSVRNNNCQDIEHRIQTKIPALKITVAAIKECGYSPGVQCLLREISNALKKAVPDAASTWYGYRPSKPSIPVFVVSLSQQKFIPEEHAVFTKLFSHYEIEFRQDQEPNDEETIASKMLKEMTQKRNIGKTTIDDEMLLVQQCIGKHAKRLMQEHSNLSIIKASTIKTRDFVSSNMRVDEQPCIVFYVPVKGIIPFGEKEFEKTIEGIQTDVREGEFVHFVRHKAHKYQEKLKMGCGISTEEDQSGTLGGFVDLPDAEKKIGFITSAHVVLNKKEIQEFRKSVVARNDFNRSLQNGEKEILIYQPNKRYPAVGRVYQICIEPGDEKNASVDVAIVHITNDVRIPHSGEFPDGDFRHIGYTKKEPMMFTSGEIEEKIQPSHKGCLVIKYGAISGITRGCFNWTKMYCKDVDMYKKLPFSVLYNQLLVTSAEDGEPFACQGDSGALVFRCDGGNLDNLKAIGMITGGSTNRGPGCMYCVTPILDIFRQLGFQKREFKRFLESDYSQQQGSTVAEAKDSEQNEERLATVENAVSEIKEEITVMREQIMSLKRTVTDFINSITKENATA